MFKSKNFKKSIGALGVLFTLLFVAPAFAIYQEVDIDSSFPTPIVQTSPFDDCSTAGLTQAYYKGAPLRFDIGSYDPNGGNQYQTYDGKIYYIHNGNLSASATSFNANLPNPFKFLSNVILGYPIVYLTSINSVSPHIYAWDSNNRNSRAAQIVVQGKYERLKTNWGCSKEDYEWRDRNNMSYPVINNVPIETTRMCRDGNGSFYTVNSCVNIYIAKCGDGVVDTQGVQLAGVTVKDVINEQCDDGNTNNNDSCSNTCQINEPNDPPTCQLTFDGSTATNRAITVGESIDIECDGQNANRGRWTRDNESTPLSQRLRGYPLPVGEDYTFSLVQDYVVQCQTQNAEGDLSPICEATVTVEENIPDRPNCSDFNFDLDSSPVEYMTPFDVERNTNVSNVTAMAVNGGSVTYSAGSTTISNYSQNAIFNFNVVIEGNWAGGDLVCPLVQNVYRCEIDISEDEVYVYEDGSFEPTPVTITYDIQGLFNTTIQSNVPGVEGDGNGSINILSNIASNYYIRAVFANNSILVQCSDTIDLDSCGDNQLQPAYEECEINTLIMPAPGVINNLETLLPDYFNDFSKQKIGGVYAALFDRKKEVSAEITDFNDTRALRAPGVVKQPIPSDGDGCSATCQLETPTCNVVVGPGEISAGERAYFSGQTQDWSTFLTLDYEEGGPTYNFANSFPGGLPVAYFHFDSGVYYDGYDNPMIGYNYMATVQNARGMAGSRQLINPLAVRPSNICGGDTSVNETLVDVEKSLLQEGTVFMSGDDVGFQIIVSNDSSGRVYGLSVTDYFSPLLNWDGNIEIVGLGNNTVVTSGIVSSGLNLQWITVSNIDLAPMSTGAIYLTGRMYSHLCNWPNTGVLTGDALDEPIWFGASFPCGPVADIQKFQSTGTSLDSFTQELIQVEIGDSLNYRVEFANNGGSPTNGGVTIRDYLPAGITYIGSEILVYTGGAAVVPSPLYTEQGTVGNQDYIIYSGFDLASGQSGYMMIYGEVSDNMNYVIYENIAELEFANPYQSGVSNTVVAVRGDVSVVDFQKNIIDGSGNMLTSGDNIPYFFSGDEIIFEISIENHGDAISGIILDDIWPDPDQDCILYSGWTSPDISVTVGRSWEPRWRWTYGPTLPEFGRTTLLLYGEVIGGQECVGSYANTGLLRYYQNGTLYTGVAEVPFEIRDANMLLTKTADSSDVSVGSEITFFLYFENNGSHTISNFVLTDLRPATLALQPSLTHPKPYTYIGPGNPSFSPPQAIDGGRELQWNRGNQEFLPGMTGMIILTGIVLDAQEAIELYEATH